MFIVLLKFSNNKKSAPQHMANHNIWITAGIDAGTFLLAGSLQPGLGGALIAHNISMDELLHTLSKDPFVAHDVVKPEILEIIPAKMNPHIEAILKPGRS
jgi:uncharacterized protein YciI